VQIVYDSIGQERKGMSTRRHGGHEEPIDVGWALPTKNWRRVIALSAIGAMAGNAHPAITIERMKDFRESRLPPKKNIPWRRKWQD
jgi:hypothetical protein